MVYKIDNKNKYDRKINEILDNYNLSDKPIVIIDYKEVIQHLDEIMSVLYNKQIDWELEFKDNYNLVNTILNNFGIFLYAGGNLEREHLFLTLINLYKEFFEKYLKN